MTDLEPRRGGGTESMATKASLVGRIIAARLSRRSRLHQSLGETDATSLSRRRVCVRGPDTVGFTVSPATETTER